MSPPPHTQSETSEPTRGKTVLVVDDDQDFCAALAETLGEEGYDVLLAADGSEALAALDPVPDVILLDLYMPGMDGWAFMAERRKNAKLAPVPVVLMTARGEATFTRAPVAAGYLPKPLGRERLLETIGRCLLLQMHKI